MTEEELDAIDLLCQQGRHAPIVAELVAELRTAQTELAAANDSSRMAWKVATNIGKRVSATEAENTELRAQLADVEAQFADARGTIDSLRSQIDRLFVKRDGFALNPENPV